MTVEKTVREFTYNGMRLPDPNPAMTVEQVQDLYAATYPEISTASVTGPEAVGSKLRYCLHESNRQQGLRSRPCARSTSSCRAEPPRLAKC